MALTLSSPAFVDGGDIPQLFTCDGSAQGVSRQQVQQATAAHTIATAELVCAPLSRKRRAAAQMEVNMQRRAVWLSSIGAGAAAAYFFDPAWGNRRRAVARDALVRTGHVLTSGTAKASRDLRNRIRGVGAAATHLAWRDRPDDDVLEERVRAALGRVVSHPHAIKVDAHDGRVMLSGPILASEEPALVSTVTSVRGVRRVENHLEQHERANNTPALQGGPSRLPGPPVLDVRQRHWAPATRLIVGGAGAGMIAVGANQRHAAGATLVGAGAVLLARAVTNIEFKRLAGVGAGRRAIDVQKTITVNVPVADVFGFWDHFPNFPAFMRNVREVRPTRDPLQWHWVVSGPADVPIEFDAIVTQRIPNRVLAWKTAEGSTVGHAGLVRFDPVGFGATRVQMRLSYNPPGGALAHGVLTLFGADPKRLLDEDLVRMKTALETGRRAHDAAAPSQASAHPA